MAPLLHARYGLPHALRSTPMRSSRRFLATIGIRREDKSRWERRAPLTPSAVGELVRFTGTKVYVQPSTKRIFNDHEYVKHGAIVTEDLHKADIILGIKEVPEAALLPGKTYLFFSHTHKGNEANRAMLQDILDKKIRLIDYELMTDSQGKRLVAFGHYAGAAGMVDMLHGMGQRFLGLGYSTPFMYLPMCHAYPTLELAQDAVSAVGQRIAEQGTPNDFGPLVFAVTGGGNVTKGALQVLKHLPHDMLDAKDLEKVVADKNPNLNKVYVSQLAVQDYMQRKDGARFDYNDYRENPDQYVSVFDKTVAPYASCIVTGAYWDSRFPRLLDNNQLKKLQTLKSQGVLGPGRMMGLADIVCDVRGAFECLSHTTSIDDGFYYYDAVNNIEHKDVEKPGLQILGVDILPAELPMDSSRHFSNMLLEHVVDLVRGQPSRIVKDAIIADHGELVPAHRHLKSVLSRKKTVLLLGSGMVAGPCVRYWQRRSDVNIVIASNALAEANSLAAGHSRTTALPLDISDQHTLGNLVQNADVVVSLLPATLHYQVAKTCIAHRKHMVTASYVSPEMATLDKAAQQNDLVFMNEVGLDPGIDHMSAMKIMDDTKRQGNQIRSFISWCGGLPAPEASNVPFGYRFSWSPRGVLTASGNDALYWSGGKHHTIPGDHLLRDHFPSVKTPYYGFVFEGLANRNALGYADIYGLGDVTKLDTMFRGTLRYKGFSDLMYGFRQLGFLSLDKLEGPPCTSSDEFVTRVIGERNGDRLTPALVANRLGVHNSHPMVHQVWQTLVWLTEGPKIPMENAAVTPLDGLSRILAQRLPYEHGQRDMVAMQHEIGIQHKQTGKRSIITSTLIEYADADATAMARTVGLPTAMATELVLDNKITQRGVLRPVFSEIYLPVMEALEDHGIRFVETCVEAPQEPTVLNTPRGSGYWE